MNNKIKSIFILSLVSTTALSSYASVSPKNLPITHGNLNNKVDIYKGGAKEINITTPKMIKAQRQEKYIADNIKPFILKQIIFSLDDQEVELASIAQIYLHNNFTNEQLDQLKAQVAGYYLAQDYLLPQVSIAKIDGKHGSLKLNIKTGSINDVIIMGEGEKNPLMQEYAQRILAVKPSKIHHTQRYLALMNKLPGYEISYQLKQIENQPDKIDLLISTHKKKWSTYLGADNYGINKLGEYQISGLSQIYSPFGGNQSLLFHAATSNHPDRLNDVGIGYSQPINACGTNLNLFAGHSEDNPSKADLIKAKTNQGNSFRTSLSHHLLLRTTQDLEVEIGTQYKNLSSYTVNNNVPTQSKSSNNLSGDLGVKYLFKDKIDGKNLFHTSFVQGIDGKFKNYLEDNIADKHYKLMKFNFYRDQPLQYDFSIFSHLGAKYSDDKLPDYEKSSLGGREFGRGYASGTIDGSRLIGFSAELRYTKKIADHLFIEHIQPYLFQDIGHLSKLSANTNISTLKSAGAGVRFKLHYNFDIGAEVAQPYKKSYTVNGVNQKAKTNFGVFVNKVFEF